MRNKLALGLLFGFLIAVFAGLIHVISKSVVSKGVVEIEMRDVGTDMDELHSLLDSKKMLLNHHVFDWAVLNNSYYYIQNNDKSYIDESFTESKINEMHFTGAAYYDNNGTRLSFIDGSKLEYGDDWTEYEARAFDRIVKFVREKGSESFDGFVNVEGVAMAVAVHKVFDSRKEKSSNGYLIMSSAIDWHFREWAQKISGLDFSILPLARYEMADGTAVKDGRKVIETDGVILAYSVINDVFGKPAFCLELRKPRSIAEFGKEMSHKNFLLMLILCVLVLCVGLIIIHFAHQHGIRLEMNFRLKHDALTWLPNLKCFLERLPAIMKEASRNGDCLAVVYLNTKNFKSVNDSYGYSQGDEVLKEIASRLRTLEAPERVARSSADRFLVAISDARQDAVKKRAQKILEALQKPFNVKGNALFLSICMGLAFLPEECENETDFVHYAELAMHNAHKNGGNSISFFDELMKTEAFEKKQIEIDLRNAIEQRALTVYYQPKVDIAENDVAGCEALVRWQTENGQWVPPPVFIPVAEEAGLVTQIDMFVLRTACRQALQWQKDGSGAVPVSVNMSVRSILSDGFADAVLRILEEEGAPSSLIDIEITESCFMSDMETAFKAISRLHEAGLHVELDDFGTGYSSLQYLSAMPISILKIDKQFVDDIFSGKEAAQPLVKSIISLAVSLGMHTVSEGVEDRKQLDFLASNGAHIIQGYLFSKPLSASDCGEFLRNRKVRIEAVMKAA